MDGTPHYLKETYGDIQVSWLPELDGGGRSFGQAYLPVVRELLGKTGRIYEFCCGPAFIGFSLLAEGLCKSLCLSDINPKAVAAVRDTISRHGLQDRVQVYQSDSLTSIPPEEKWDLVVSNPPHFEVETEEAYHSNIRLNDRQWKIHREFYEKVGAHLAPGGSILMQENHLGSEESTFDSMVTRHGLEPVDSFMFKAAQRGIMDPYFYYWVQPKGGSHRMDRAAHPQLVFNRPELLELDTRKSARLELDSGRRYRLRVTNNTSSPLPVVVWKKRYGVLWRQALAPLWTLEPGEMASAPVRFGRGTYQVRTGDLVLASARVA